MLNAAVMPTTHKTVRHQSRNRSDGAGNELRKKLRANAGSDQENSSERHADEKFYLVMQQAAVVEEADDGEQRGAGEDADDLLLRRVVPREQHGEYEAQVNSDAAEQRDGIQMNFAGPGFIHHAVAQREMTNRHGEARATRAARWRRRSVQSVIRALRLCCAHARLDTRGIFDDCDEAIQAHQL